MGDRRGGSVGSRVRHTQQHQRALGLYPFSSQPGALKPHLPDAEPTHPPPEH